MQEAWDLFLLFPPLWSKIINRTRFLLGFLICLLETMLTVGRLTAQPAFMFCVYLSNALIVATGSDLLLWSKGKHLLVSGVLTSMFMLCT